MLGSSYWNIRWAFNVNNWKPTKQQWKIALQCVQKEERERCDKFCFVEDCKSSMIGRLLMRKVVNECCNIPYGKICFLRSESGKPFLANEENHLNFNISHHGDYCVLATTQHQFKVGIDVMKIEHRSKTSVEDFFTTMKKQFSSYEWDFITQPGLEIEQLGRFYRLWCLKESYVKATGTGIACDLRKISFLCPSVVLCKDVVTTDTKLYLDGTAQPQWNFEEMLLDKNHCVAVAVKINESASNVRVKEFRREGQNFTFLSFEDLMKNCEPFETVEENFWEFFTSKSEKGKL